MGRGEDSLANASPLLRNLKVDRMKIWAALDQRGFAEWAVIKLIQDFAGALQWDVVVLVEVHRLRLVLHSVLHRLGHPQRKFGSTITIRT